MRGKEHGTIWVLNAFTALTGVAQLVGHHPPKQKVASSGPVGAHAWVAALSPVGAHARGN